MFRRGKLFIGCILLIMTVPTIIDIAQRSKEDEVIRTKSIVKKFFASDPPKMRSRNKTQSLNVSKWIVITSVAYATEAIKALATEKEWRVVVVADVETPYDWYATNCDFLSVEKQGQLAYAINSHVPNNSYTRKMIGYLYAIENGAEWIYDTDDDNQPIERGLAQFDLKSGNISGISFLEEVPSRRAKGTENSFFGQPGMWPRGYPLENVKEENNNNSYVLCKEQKAPAIQQGLVRKDPDVDAIYRLLHADKKDGLEVNFNPHAPPIILNKGVYCPFNSQNTLFHRDAFWALFLPVSVAFRVTDIWRSYFAQKLLHLTDNRIGFYPANALQKRNAHSYLADFNDEMLFYSNAGRLVDFLTHWNCRNASLIECMVELSDSFVRHEFWDSSDFALTKAWIADLNSLEYKFPAIFSSTLDTRNAHAKDCRKVSLNFAAKVEKRMETAQKGYNELKDWCSVANGSFTGRCFNQNKNFNDGVWGKLKKTALIITSNYAFGPSISLLQRFYEPYFATVIFCGPIYLDRIHSSNVSAYFLPVLPLNYINVSENEINDGYRAYICPAKAIEMRLQNISGYMVIADDTVYNFWSEFDTSRFRIAAITKAKNGIWWDHPWGIGEAAMNTSISLLRNRTAFSPDSELNKELTAFSKEKGEDVFPILNELLWSISDFFFVPRSCASLFYELSEVFFEAKLFHEIAVPSLAAVCGMDWRKLIANATERDIDADKYKHLWGESWKEQYSNELIYLHPVKLSTVTKIEERRSYCDGPLKFYAEALSSPDSIATTTSTTTTTSSSTTTSATTSPSTAALTTTSTVPAATIATSSTKVLDSTSTSTTTTSTASTSTNLSAAIH